MKTPQDHFHGLIFRLTGKLYGVDARLVLEVVRLPEITPMEDAPPFVAGVINLRDRVVPVVDLNIRMGRLPDPSYQLTDAIVVVEQAGVAVGIIINDLVDVRPLDTCCIDPAPSFDPAEFPCPQVVENVARLEDALVMLINPQRLLYQLPTEPDLSTIAGTEDNPVPCGANLSERRIFSQKASQEERDIFRQRAQRLRHPPSGAVQTLPTALAVVRLQGEAWGVRLETIRGFAPVPGFTPIPGTPPHIAGSMNLRGEILTLVDISHFLGLPVNPHARLKNMVIVEISGLKAGVLVEEIEEIIHLTQQDILPGPVASGSLNGEFLRGAALYGEGMMGILDLRTLITSPQLRVNEHI